MNQRSQQSTSTFQDIVAVLLRWRRFIGRNVGVVVLLSIILSLLLPNWFASTVSLLPPKTSGDLFGQVAGFSTALKDISKTLGGLGQSSDESFNYLAILKSRTALVKVIERFDLRSVYEVDNNTPMEVLIEELAGNVNLEVQEEGNITLTVYDKLPQRAADMANYFVDVLNNISIDLSTQSARNNRQFIEHRYREVQRDLAAAEDSLKRFQERHSLYALPEQTKAAIEAAAELKSQMLLKEMEIGFMKRTLGEDAPQIYTAQVQLGEMSRKLNEMSRGVGRSRSENDLRLFPPFKDLPEIGTEYVRRYRDFEIQNKLLEFIVPVYEQARIEEAKTIPVVLVLDRAVPAERKARPTRSLIVFFSAVFAFVFSALIVLIIEAFERLKQNPDRYRQIENEIIIPLRTTFGFLGRAFGKGNQSSR